MKWKALALLLITTIAQAEDAPVEAWECRALATSWSQILVVASHSGTELNYLAKVKVAGIEHDAKYAVNGFNRRWNFGLDNNMVWNYAFIIEPDGTGTYYDFTGSEDNTAKPSQIFQCRIKG